MPCPTPMHIVAAPFVPDGWAASWWTSVVRMRAPEQPSGWPRAIAPPSGLTRAGSRSSSAMTASDWAANASLSSMMASSSTLPAGPVERQTQRRGRSDAHPRRLDAGAGPRHDARQRTHSVTLEAGRRGKQHGGRAVVERAGVAGRHRAVGGEHRLQRGQPFEGGVGTGSLVGDDIGTVDVHRYQLAVEAATCRGGDGPAVALEGEAVLGLAVDGVLARQDLGRHARG